MQGPIVIIGAARSGTKILRDILASGASTRQVPYDVNYVWRYGVQGIDHDRLDPAALTDAQARFIRRTLTRLAAAGPGDVLIEKTVGNTLRVPYVRAVLPEARFVHLIRDGRDVTESAMRQWQAPPDWRALARKLRGMPLANAGYALWFGRNFMAGKLSGRGGGKVWGPRYPGIAQDAATLPLHLVCARQWQRSVEQARADLAALPTGTVFDIRYEDFVADPAALERLVAGLALPDASGILDAWRARVRPEPAGRYAALPEDTRHEIENMLSDTLSTLGYMRA